jgi:hypothetical protein
MNQRMLAAYVSQGTVLAPFATDVETFRAADDYDFTQLPNGGCLHYEMHDWGMTGHRWLALVDETRQQLRLRDVAWLSAS